MLGVEIANMLMMSNCQVFFIGGGGGAIFNVAHTNEWVVLTGRWFPNIGLIPCLALIVIQNV